jgi:hypothetical protein
MELEIPLLRDIPAVLEPDIRATRGDRELADPIAGACSVGEPIVHAVTTELAGADTALTAFIQQTSSTWQFHVVFLGCSFNAPDGMHFDKAWLTVHLERADGAVPAPIAWSIDPLRLARAVERTRSISLGASLGIGKASVDVSSTGQADELFVEAFGLQESACTWEFSRTTAEIISGTQRLVLVTRSPVDAPSAGRVEIRATLSRRRFSVIPYRVTTPERPYVCFELVSE